MKKDLNELTDKFKQILDKSQEIKPIAEPNERPESTFNGVPKVNPEEDKFKPRKTKEVLFLLKLDVDSEIGYNVTDICLQLLEYIASGAVADDDILIKNATMSPVNIADAHTVTLSEHPIREYLTFNELK
jgi:hypothetical protein